MPPTTPPIWPSVLLGAIQTPDGVTVTGAHLERLREAIAAVSLYPGARIERAALTSNGDLDIDIRQEGGAGVARMRWHPYLSEQPWYAERDDAVLTVWVAGDPRPGAVWSNFAREALASVLGEPPVGTETTDPDPTQVLDRVEGAAATSDAPHGSENPTDTPPEPPEERGDQPAHEPLLDALYRYASERVHKIRPPIFGAMRTTGGSRVLEVGQPRGRQILVFRSRGALVPGMFGLYDRVDPSGGGYSVVRVEPRGKSSIIAEERHNLDAGSAWVQFTNQLAELLWAEERDAEARTRALREASAQVQDDAFEGPPDGIAAAIANATEASKSATPTTPPRAVPGPADPLAEAGVAARSVEAVVAAGRTFILAVAAGWCCVAAYAGWRLAAAL